MSPFSSPWPEKPLTGFDQATWFYDGLAALVFGPTQRHAQRAALTGLPATLRPHLLILGGGTGWVLTEVLRRRPGATVLYLEASRNMLARAQQRLAHEMPGAAAQVEFRHGNQASLGPAERFDAVVTFFVLDCIALPELDGAIETLHRALKPGAPWLLADFRPATRGWRRLLLRLMYAFFRLTTGLRATELGNFRELLAARKLQAQRTAYFFFGAIESVVFAEQGRESQP